MKSLPQHLFDYLKDQEFLGQLYRSRCWAFWQERYGSSVVSAVKKMWAEYKGNQDD